MNADGYDHNISLPEDSSLVVCHAMSLAEKFPTFQVP